MGIESPHSVSVKGRIYSRLTAPLAAVVPVAVACAVFGWLAIRTETARKELATVQAAVTQQNEARELLEKDVRRLAEEKQELSDTNDRLHFENEKEQKALADMEAQRDKLIELAAKEDPTLTGEKLASLLEAESPKERAQALFLAGKIAQSHRDYARARALLSDAVAQYPDYAEALNVLGLVAEMQGDRTGAESFYKRAIAVDAGYLFPMQNLALLLLARKDLAGARSLAERILKLKPDYRPAKEILERASPPSPPVPPP